MEVRREAFGELKDGTSIDTIRVTNSRGVTLRFITFGGILTSAVVPDRNGTPADVVCGFDSIGQYEAKHPYFGALVGRFANRIGGASFVLDGTTYKLFANTGAASGGAEPRNHLHGGAIGFDKRVWDAETFSEGSFGGVSFRLESPDGEEGYPGNLSVEVRCTLNEANEFTLDYTATTDAPTPINLTNHAYWNLAGAGSGTVNNHLLTLDCPGYLVVNEELIPTGEIADVAGTPMDFLQAKRVGQDLPAVPGGYDHCFVSADQSAVLKEIATLVDPESGRRMDVRTTKPAVQFYGGNFLDGSLAGKGGLRYDKHSALCLETQYYPDAMNHDNFPSCILRPGDSYRHTTVYTFGLA